jgi:hypothetical protein
MRSQPSSQIWIEITLLKELYLVVPRISRMGISCFGREINTNNICEDVKQMR